MTSQELHPIKINHCTMYTGKCTPVPKQGGMKIFIPGSSSINLQMYSFQCASVICTVIRLESFNICSIGLQRPIKHCSSFYKFVSSFPEKRGLRNNRYHFMNDQKQGINKLS